MESSGCSIGPYFEFSGLYLVQHTEPAPRVQTLKLAPNSPQPCHLKASWSAERLENRACDLGRGTKFTGASPIQGPESSLKTEHHCVESRARLPASG